MTIKKECKFCKNLFSCKPSHYDKKTYCSKKCMAQDYKKRLLGNENPNFKMKGVRVCKICSKIFHNYNKKRKYCSNNCYQNDPITKQRLIKNSKIGIDKIKGMQKKIRIKIKKEPKPIHLRKKTGPKKSTPKPNKVCFKCNKEYHSYNKGRKYCSYKCHLNNGGSFKAGMASVKMRQKYGHKKDANHNAIQEAFLKVGIPFYDLSQSGCGVPDAIIWIRRKWEFIEIKNLNTAYGRRGLNKNQKKWIENWKGGGVYIIKNLEDVENMIKGKLDGITYYCNSG